MFNRLSTDKNKKNYILSKKLFLYYNSKKLKINNINRIFDYKLYIFL